VPDIDLRTTHEQLAACQARIAELDAIIAAKDAKLAKFKLVFHRQRERIGRGWRHEVLEFSDSLKDMLTQ
jgi:hypothetical protein